MSLEITLAVALFVVGLLIDRRASRRRRTADGPGVRAIAHPGAPITVALQVSGTAPLGTELVAAGAGEASEQPCGGPGR
jgi:hypothetical protein